MCKSKWFKFIVQTWEGYDCAARFLMKEHTGVIPHFVGPLIPGNTHHGHPFKCRMSHHGFRMSDVESRMSDVGSPMSNVGSPMSNVGCRISEVGCYKVHVLGQIISKFKSLSFSKIVYYCKRWDVTWSSFWSLPTITSSPGSSRFPIWRRQERRPWHTAN